MELETLKPNITNRKTNKSLRSIFLQKVRF